MSVKTTCRSSQQQTNKETSGQDYLGEERASCLMHTHGTTVYCRSSSSPSNSMFPGLGFESQSRSFFRFFFFSHPSATVNQWRIFFEWLYRLIDWLINMSCHWSHITKNCLDWDSNPRPGNTWDLKGKWNCHSIQCSNGCALSSWLFLRQGDQVQRCTVQLFT